MGKFKVPKFDKIVFDYNEQKKILMGKHNATKVEELTQPRRGQIQFLDAVLNEFINPVNPFIPPLENKNKAYIFTGLLIIMARLIDNTYKGSLADPKRSLLRKSIDKIISLDELNILDDYTASGLITEAMKFLGAAMYVDGNTNNPLIVDHPFQKIDKFNMHKFSTLGTQMAAEHRTAAQNLKEAERQQEVEKERAATKGNKSIFAGLFGASAKKVQPLVDIDPENDSDDTSDEDRREVMRHG